MIFLLKLVSSNYPSVGSALSHINREFKMISVSEIFALPKQALLIIPGVGSIVSISNEFFSQVDHAKTINFLEDNDIKIFGICLGFQFLFSQSMEGPDCKCLGLFPGCIEPVYQPLKPSVGWSKLSRSSSSHIPSKFDNLILHKEFYFTHSYGLRLQSSHMETIYEYKPDNSPDAIVAAVFDRQFSGTQFHPEKSGKHGLALLKSITEPFG
jgi:glutamine amidotransferase